MSALSPSDRSPLCQSVSEERASMVTHGLGIVLSVVALGWMLLVAGKDPYKVVSAAVFGLSLILLYSSSTFYHAISAHGWKSLFQYLDHACIYLLIAGSYTPLSLVTLRGPWGWGLLGSIWFLALAGVVMKSLWRTHRTAWWSTALYLLMGWLAVIAMGPIVRALPVAAVAWIIAGGLCYSLGVIFFVWQRLRFNHAIWHLFVLAGSTCHVLATVLYILPGRGPG